MSKSEYIEAFSTKIKDYREPAKGFIVLLKHQKIANSQINEIYILCSEIVGNMQNIFQKRNLQLTLDHIAKIKTKQKRSESVLSDQDLNTILLNM